GTAVVDLRVGAQHGVVGVGGQQLNPVGAVQEAGHDAAVVGTVAVQGGVVGHAVRRPEDQRQLLQGVGLAVAVVGRAAGQLAAGDGADVLVLGLLHEQDVGGVQVVGDLGGDAGQLRLVVGLRGGDVVE